MSRELAIWALAALTLSALANLAQAVVTWSYREENRELKRLLDELTRGTE